ncbi:MAG TPA: hypothetical protein VMV92_31470 [Streptosporangiaceae bacterium]|nr:hypothetical protein [Streptosporangiaceae bacterium]
MTQIRQALPLSTDCPIPELSYPVPAVSQELASLGCDDGLRRAHRALRVGRDPEPAGPLHAEAV